MTTFFKIQRLPDWMTSERDKACQRLAKDLRTSGRSTNGATVSFLRVLATALLLVDTSSLFVWYELFQYLNGRALAGDEDAKRIFGDVQMLLEDVAAVSDDDTPAPETETDGTQMTDGVPSR